MVDSKPFDTGLEKGFGKCFGSLGAQRSLYAWLHISMVEWKPLYYTELLNKNTLLSQQILNRAVSWSPTLFSLYVVAVLKVTFRCINFSVFDFKVGKVYSGHFFKSNSKFNGKRWIYHYAIKFYDLTTFYSIHILWSLPWCRNSLTLWVNY